MELLNETGSERVNGSPYAYRFRCKTCGKKFVFTPDSLDVFHCPTGCATNVARLEFFTLDEDNRPRSFIALVYSCAINNENGSGTFPPIAELLTPSGEVEWAEITTELEPPQQPKKRNRSGISIDGLTYDFGGPGSTKHPLPIIINRTPPNYRYGHENKMKYPGPVLGFNDTVGSTAVIDLVHTNGALPLVPWSPEAVFVGAWTQVSHETDGSMKPHYGNMQSHEVILLHREMSYEMEPEYDEDSVPDEANEAVEF